MKQILNFAFESKLDKVHRESTKVLDIFTKTTADLQKLNTQIEEETATKLAEQKKLAEDLQKLSSLKENHDKVIAKIAKIFE